MAADILRTLLRDAARAAEMPVYVQAPMDISTPAGVRKPDVAVIGRDAARVAHEQNVRTFHGRDVLLVVEVVSRRSGSEQVERIDKLADYGEAGIASYWIVDLEPHPLVQLYALDGTSYRLAGTVHAGSELATDSPFPVSFDPSILLDLDKI